jgi:hypothetical protein
MTDQTPVTLGHLRRLAERLMPGSSIRHAIEELCAEPPPEPAPLWSDWFEHDLGECPLPPNTVMQLGDCSTRFRASVGIWSNITSYRYACDEPGGWLKRPYGWVPPESAYPLKVKNTIGHQTVIDRPKTYAWSNVTHFRLLPRERKAEPALPKRTEAEAYEQGWLDAMTEADKLSPSPCRIVDQVLVCKHPQEVVDEWRSAIRKRVEERRRG